MVDLRKWFVYDKDETKLGVIYFMLTAERHSMIIQLLNEKHSIKIQDIVKATAASESTIRRDLTDLEAQGKLVRIHGGAILPERKLQEFSLKEKSTKNLHEKTPKILHNWQPVSLMKGIVCLLMQEQQHSN